MPRLEHRPASFIYWPVGSVGWCRPGTKSDHFFLPTCHSRSLASAPPAAPSARCPVAKRRRECSPAFVTPLASSTIINSQPVVDKTVFVFRNYQHTTYTHRGSCQSCRAGYLLLMPKLRPLLSPGTGRTEFSRKPDGGTYRILVQSGAGHICTTCRTLKRPRVDDT